MVTDVAMIFFMISNELLHMKCDIGVILSIFLLIFGKIN